MAEAWKPADRRTFPVHLAGEPAEAVLVYYRGGKEGRHDVHLGDRVLEVRPDGTSSAANRSRVIAETLTAEHYDPLVYLVGALTLAGAVNLELTTRPEEEPT